MIRVVAAVALGTVTSGVEAAEFRTVQFGTECSTIYDYEIAHGSRAESDGGRDDRRVFSGLDHGMPSRIVYLCSGGKFLVGNVNFLVKSHDEAAKDFIAIYAQFRAQYGEPFDVTIAHRDLMPPVPDPMPRIGEPVEIVIDWLLDDEVVTLGLTDKIAGSDGRWSANFHVSQRSRPGT